MKISEAYNKFINEFLTLKGAGKSQINHYKTCKRYLCEILGDKDIEELSIDDIATFVLRLRNYGTHRCNNTLIEYICEIRMVLRYWKIRGVNCLEYSLIPVPQKEPRPISFLTAEEVDQIIAKQKNVRTKFIISLLYSSGIRVSELTQLNRDSIVDGQFTVLGKGKKLRICFADKRTLAYMDEYFEARTDNLLPLIITKMGTRASTSTIQLIIRNACAAAGLRKRVTPHTFRHSFATNFIQNNGNIRYLAELLGHSNIRMTQHYTHVVNTQLKEIYKQFHTF